MPIQNSPGVGVVGCGYWGKNLVRVFSELGHLAAICDSDRPRLEDLSRSYPAVAVNRYEELLAMPEVRGVVVAAPAAQHYALAKQALLAGKDVFVEKPLALRLQDGEELVQLAKAASRILMVGHLLHYHPAIVMLRQRIREGDLGRIEYISSSRLNLGRLRMEEDILWSFAPHDIAAIVHLLEENPTCVTAQGASYLNHPISDVTLTFLSFESGVKAHIFVSWLHPFKEQKLVVVGSRKMAVFDDTQTEAKLMLYPHRIDWINRVPVARKMDGEVVPLPPDEPLKAECQHFLECLQERKKPNTDGEIGLGVLRILHLASESIRNHGQPIYVRREPGPRYFADPSAIVDQPCEIGEGTKIWHFSHVMANCKIGNKCNLGQNVHVASGVRIGDNVKIQNNVSLYSGVELEDDVFCGPSMVFTNVINPRSHVNRKSEYQKTVIRRGASLGANSTIVCGVTVGKYALIGAGVPARRIGWVCKCGVTLMDSGTFWSCSACGLSYALTDGAMQPLPTSASAASAPGPRTMAASAGED